MKVQIIGNVIQQVQIGADQDVVFANSAAANTQNSLSVTAPESPSDQYELIVYNPSTITDLTVKVFNVELALALGTRDALITTLTIPKAATVTGTTINTHVNFITGAFNGGDLKLVVSNATVLGVADGFTASFRLRAV